MANHAIDDHGHALDHTHLGTDWAARLSHFERHHIPNYARLAADHEQIILMCSLNDDISEHPENTVRRWCDVESGVASATGHVVPLPLRAFPPAVYTRGGCRDNAQIKCPIVELRKVTVFSDSFGERLLGGLRECVRLSGSR
jgi:hypothetical protein